MMDISNQSAITRGETLNREHIFISCHPFSARLSTQCLLTISNRQRLLSTFMSENPFYVRKSFCVGHKTDIKRPGLPSSPSV